jgi:hypothetical protein
LPHARHASRPLCHHSTTQDAGRGASEDFLAASRFCIRHGIERRSASKASTAVEPGVSDTNDDCDDFSIEAEGNVRTAADKRG